MLQILHPYPISAGHTAYASSLEHSRFDGFVVRVPKWSHDAVSFEDLLMLALDPSDACPGLPSEPLEIRIASHPRLSGVSVEQMKFKKELPEACVHCLLSDVCRFM